MSKKARRGYKTGIHRSIRFKNAASDYFSFFIKLYLQYNAQTQAASRAKRKLRGLFKGASVIVLGNRMT
jgi:hypothetical protein